jgi:hypothetical protein
LPSKQYRPSPDDNPTAKLVLFNAHQRYEGGDIGPAFLEARVQHRRWIGCEKLFFLSFIELTVRLSENTAFASIETRTFKA